MIIGIDTGGTFTDFVFYDGEIQQLKLLSTPHAPEQAILKGLSIKKVDFNKATIIHGSTVATNAVLESKGAKVVYISNKGLGDVLKIARQNRQELYNLTPMVKPTPVDTTPIIEIDGRVDKAGKWLKKPTKKDYAHLTAQLKQINPDAVAVNCLFSYLNKEQELLIQQAIPKGIYCSLSHQVLPQYKEYERGVTTWMNAYVGPKMQHYLQRLHNKISPVKLSIMQSTGGTISAKKAAKFAVQLLLSGPAGGLNGALDMAKKAKTKKILTFDMGGTSTDVAILNKTISLSQNGRIANLPVAVPMVDMHTIGAGGGSIATVDQGGFLKVGPESAGANPGPACYNLGGQEATVTDANVVLGRIVPDYFTVSDMQLNVQQSFNVIEKLAKKLKLSSYQTAEGIVQIAEQHMAEALRLISVKQGLDAREYVLTSFGGAGGLHICALADALECKQAMIPPMAGVLSAYGMITATTSRLVSKTLLLPLQKNQQTTIIQQLNHLANKAQQQIQDEVKTATNIHLSYQLDCRYQGQSSTLVITVKNSEIDISTISQQFQQQHQQFYGYNMDNEVELVNIVVEASLAKPNIALSPLANSPQIAPKVIKIVQQQKTQTAYLYQRQQLVTGQVLKTPALVVEAVATSYIAKNWQAVVGEFGHIQITKII